MKNILHRNCGRLKAATIALVAACVAFVVTGCGNPFNGGVDTEKGSLVLSAEGRRLERTIMPGTGLDRFASFRLEFSAVSEGNEDFGMDWVPSYGVVELNAGTWNLEVTAYMTAGGDAVARGVVKGIVVAPKATVSRTVALVPIAGGEGTFRWDMTFPDDLASATMEIRQWPDGTTAFREPSNLLDTDSRVGSLNLPAGMYRVIFVLVNGNGERAMASEILQVYRDMESVFQTTFEDRHFVTLHSLADQLRWLRDNAQAGGSYVLELSGDESITSEAAQLPSDIANISITIRGDWAMRTVTLSGMGSLFWVPSGVTLELGGDVTLRGVDDNDMSLVLVSGGTFVMNDGTVVTGNTSFGGSGGGVQINDGGTFTMHGGEILNNTVGGSPWGGADGGGVFVGNGTFTMYGGTISGNYATTTTPTGWVSGGGVAVGSQGGMFRMFGGVISGNRASSAAQDRATGGGVSVSSYQSPGAIFLMSGGTIYGSEAPEALRNTDEGNFSALFLSLWSAAIPPARATAQFGTFNDAGDLTPLGAFSSSNRTVEMVNGVWQNAVVLTVTGITDMQGWHMWAELLDDAGGQIAWASSAPVTGTMASFHFSLNRPLAEESYRVRVQFSSQDGNTRTTYTSTEPVFSGSFRSIALMEIGTGITQTVIPVTVTGIHGWYTTGTISFYGEQESFQSSVWNLAEDTLFRLWGPAGNYRISLQLTDANWRSTVYILASGSTIHIPATGATIEFAQFVPHQL
ncbi:MAG: hypothetical protein FWB78_04380 [Treponema sp.]|nr:hypothetical protein [Treponema sp.]